MLQLLNTAYSAAGVVSLLVSTLVLIYTRRQAEASKAQEIFMGEQIDILRTQMDLVIEARSGRISFLYDVIKSAYDDCANVSKPPYASHDEIRRLDLTTLERINSSVDVFNFTELQVVPSLGNCLKELSSVAKDAHREVRAYLAEPTESRGAEDLNAVASLIHQVHLLAGECEGLMIKHGLGN